MKIDKYFFKNFIKLLFVSVTLVSLLIFYLNNKIINTSIIVGFLLGLLNVLIGYFFIEYGYNKSIAKFLKILVGGMGLRLLILISLLFFFIKYLNLHIFTFIISLFVFYVIFLIFELVYIEKRLNSKTS